MLKAQVKIGKYYAIRHYSDDARKLSVIRIEGPNPYGGYNATKLSTGRMIRIKSAAKLRYEVELNPDTNGPKWRKVA